ncbi:hypothetical protein PLICRDRAFT_94979 [Plicaturopsis crispa FD-325 SS-3]|uniref:Uncharacterized protein n=1 Tax=Plicaturopsis crispa FD-325 SS-3 TaxID=944288 RepID=A0A0C9SY74_PLICR|nr:hypothetical protein PLICRDRAFT_94979 [Plicaturopsis crispa FD-325 SS-3]
MIRRVRYMQSPRCEQLIRYRLDIRCDVASISVIIAAYSPNCSVVTLGAPPELAFEAHTSHLCSCSIRRFSVSVGVPSDHYACCRAERTTSSHCLFAAIGLEHVTVDGDLSASICPATLLRPVLFLTFLALIVFSSLQLDAVTIA